MARLSEGVYATYVGHEPELSGHRCYMLRDEGHYFQSRWVSGPREGSIEAIASSKLAIDRPTMPTSPFEMDDDEFGFEQPLSTVGVACHDVYERGGIRALAVSLEESAMLGHLRIAVSAGLEELRRSIAGSGMWSEVASDLGEDGRAVVGTLVNQMILEAIAGENDG